MSISQGILKRGKGTSWRIKLANSALEYVSDGDIYQQDGIGMETYVIHSCPNMGEPFDAAKHRAAQAVYDATERMPRKPYDTNARKDAIAALRIIWDTIK